MINGIRDITIGVFKHIENKYKLDLGLRIKYTERIMRGLALEKSDRSCYSVRSKCRGYLDISGILGWQRVLPCNSYGLGPKCKDATGQDTPSSERNVVPNLIITCGSRW